MKNLKKRILVILSSVLMVSSLVVNASAASVTWGSSCTGNNGLANAGSACSNAKISEYLNGIDLNSLFNGLDLFGTSAPSDNKSDCGKTETAVPSSEPAPTANVVQEAVKQNSNINTTTKESNSTNAVQKQPAAVPEATTPVKAKDSTCTAKTDCATKDNCTAKADCTTNSCVTAGKQCGTVFNIGSNTYTSKAPFSYLNNIFAKYGINANIFGNCQPKNPGTPAPETPKPSGKPETPKPSEKPETPKPSPTDNSGTEPTDNGNIDNLSFEQQVVVLVNEQRAANGLAPLTLNGKLSDVARAKSQDMHDNRYFSHTSPTYGSPFDMIRSFGISYRTAGENIAMGYATPKAVVDAWMNSPGHRANILNASYTQIGVGYVADGNYWTQHFIG